MALNIHTLDAISIVWLLSHGTHFPASQENIGMWRIVLGLAS